MNQGLNEDTEALTVIVITLGYTSEIQRIVTNEK